MKIFPRKKRWYIIGLIGIFILFRIFRILFASETIDTTMVEQGDLVQETRVVGEVVAQDETLLGFGVSGRITEIFFEVGDLVEEGSLLARLDPQSSSAEYSLAAANVSRERAQLNDLLDGNREEEIAIQQDFLFVQQKEVRVTLQDLYQEVRDSRSIAEDAIRLKTDVFFRDPEGYAKLDFSAERELRESLEKERRDFDTFFDKWRKYNELLSLESFDPEVSSDQVLTNLRRINVFLTNLTQAVSEKKSTSEITEVQIQNLASARLAIDTQINDLQDALVTYQKSGAEQTRQESELALVQAGASAGEIATQRAQLEAEQARLEQASSSIFDTKIVAPFTGTITESLYEVGETVVSGTGVIGVATLDRLEIETFIPEVFIGDVTIGDQAFVSLDAYPNRSIEAEVIAVDPKQTSRDGLATYKTRLSIMSIEDLTLRLGMTSDITIITSEKKSVLSIPLEYVDFDNNQAYVSKKVGEKYQRTQIEVGIIDPEGRQEVISGLGVNDIVKKHE